jgi:transposase
VIEQNDKTVNGESIVDFLTRTRDVYQTSGTIHLILDGAGYHRSGLVTEAAEKLDINLHYLPPYGPNLNPIERLWKVMNKYARNSQYFATTKAFRRRINLFLRRPCLPLLVHLTVPLMTTFNNSNLHFEDA